MFKSKFLIFASEIHMVKYIYKNNLVRLMELFNPNIYMVQSL